VVPYTNDRYYNVRPDIAIRAQDVVSLTGDTGLHPALAPFKPLYEDGHLEIVQNVGYASPELSHFVSTDVLMSGLNANEQDNTGWSGRFLEKAYPTYADDPPDHPIALQIGASSPLLFAGNGQSLGVTFPNQSLLNRLADSGKVFAEDEVPDSHVGREISFVRRVSNDSFVYARAIRDAHNTGENLVRYSGGSLGTDLATVARLIRGGLGARIYHVTLGGFDTHAYQAGGHNTLLTRLGQAVSAFVADMQQDGLLERVSGATFSEFGRRVFQNGSSGTDHGTAAPMFIFGQELRGGLIGDAPDLVNLDGARNLISTVDFRSVYGSLLRDWFGMGQSEVDNLFGGAYPELQLFNSSISTSTSTPEAIPQRVRLNSVYPNPLRHVARVVLTLDAPGPVSLSLVDLLGRSLTRTDLGVLQAGQHDLPFEVPSTAASGTYILRVEHLGTSLARPIQVVE